MGKPFSIYKKKESPYFYVRFKNDTTGEYLSSGRSTRKTNKKEAEQIAYEWLRKGKITQDKKNTSLEALSLVNRLEQDDIDLDYIFSTLKRKGKIKGYVLPNTKADISAYQFMLDFWTWEKSPYIAEKLRKNHGIGKRHCSRNLGCIKNWWYSVLENKILGELTKDDIKNFVNIIAETKLSHGAKNDCIRAGTTALKWAYENEMIDKDITKGIIFFAGKYKERQILSPEIIKALFLVEWNDPRSKLANMLSMCTGLRAGEIQALRLQDLGENCLYINHSWNLEDGLKCTKNGESRIVQVPFPQIIQALKQLAESNPYNAGMDGFVFWATIENKPMESKTWLYELRKTLEKIGMSKETAKQFTFHSWRHFFTSYMNDKVNQKILQKQTGHKTVSMLEHYGGHIIAGDIENLRNAQVEVFGDMVSTSPEIQFNEKKLLDYVKTEYKG